MNTHFEGELVICYEQWKHRLYHDGKNMEWVLDWHLWDREGEELYVWQCQGCEQSNIWDI